MDQAKDRDDASDVTQAQEPVQLDFYGVKVRLTPSNVPKDMPDPGSWREVAQRVHQDIKAIAGGLIRLLRVTVESATNLIAGIGALPQAFTKKVDKAHAKGDDAEAAKQVASTQSSAIAATEKIRHLLNRKALGGNSVGLAIDENDNMIIIYALKAGAEESLPDLMKVVGGTLRDTGGLVSHKSQEASIWISASEDFEKLLTYLHLQGGAAIAEALASARVSIAGNHMTIVCPDRKHYDKLRSSLESREAREHFKTALSAAFGQDMTWTLMLDGNKAVATTSSS